MQQYLELVKTILDKGIRKENRTGIDTLSYFGLNLRHDLADGFPLLTTKKMDGKLWHSIVEELLWFISGENHIRNFTKKSKIWDAWADENGNLQTAYGFYWRSSPHTGGKMIDFSDEAKCNHACDELTETVGNFDQLGFCVKQLKENPDSRRLVVSAWEPYNAHKSKLPPCHLLYIFNVQNGRLCLSLTMRSVDVALGMPFNIASYALLTHIVAKEVGLIPGIIQMTFVDTHIYCADKDDESLVLGIPRKEYDHVKHLKTQLERQPMPLPTLTIKGNNSWDNHTFDDFVLENYQSHPSIKMRVAI